MAEKTWIQLNMIQQSPKWAQTTGEEPPPPPANYVPGVTRLATRVRMGATS